MRNFESGVSSKQTKEGHPFRELADSDLKGGASELFSIPDSPNVVVRKSFVNISDKESEGMSVKAKAEYLERKVKEFRRIIEGSGIRMAKTNYIIGTDTPTDQPAIFGVTERIEGENLAGMVFLDKEMADKVDVVYAKIIAGYIDSCVENGYFWHDPKNEAFVFGKAPGDEKPDIYLVDIDPCVLRWDYAEKSFQIKKEEMFWDKINLWIMPRIIEMEKKVNEKDYKFTKARETIEQAKVRILIPHSANK